MGKVTGFLEFERHDRKYAPVADRLKNFQEFVIPLTEKETRDQAARCMNCGIPYCHGTGSVAPGTPGCPVNNQIPDFNDLVYQNNWQEASRNLHSTNNFPEFTGRICPAPCEASCTLNIDDNPVTIKTIECAIVDRAWENGWIKPEVATEKNRQEDRGRRRRTRRGLHARSSSRAPATTCMCSRNSPRPAAFCATAFHDFKMEKGVIDRRVTQMEAEGVTFHYGSHVGNGGTDPRKLVEEYDAVALTGGAEAPRDLPIPGRELDGIHFAMDFLPQQNRRVGNESLDGVREILAGGKHVVVIGGGDTGSDCIGTSFRQGALSVTQLEIMPAPPEHENKGLTWPNWPLKMRTSSSQAEGAKREYAVLTQNFSGADGKVAKLHCVQVDDKFKPVAGTEFDLDAELVLLAMGFVHPVHEGLLKSLGVELDPRGNVRANTADYQTSLGKVFSAGDMRRGQSLVVWAIREGRLCARAIDTFLMGSTSLPR